jgi:RNA polymerase I-specific transcription initiation factor RRN7
MHSTLLRQHAPSTMALHGLASRLSKRMYTSYGIFTPEANGAPILWRVVSQALGGTRAFISAVQTPMTR